MISVDMACGAINRRRIVAFAYHDHDRTVIPLAVVRGRDHRWVLHAWQIDGTTARGETPPCWANSYLDEILGFTETGNTFSDSQIPDDYDPFRYRERLCEVPKIRCRPIEQPR